MTATSLANDSAAVSIDDVREVVRRYWGYDSFRPLQQEAIESSLAGRDSVVVLPTGGGKSLCFQAPACCLPGLTIVISPLISLMKDQVDALRTNGISAAYYNSSLGSEERAEVVTAIRSGSLRLLYLAPESLLSDHMMTLLGSVPLAMFAIDEAHCISSWGHDFRPEYRKLRVLKERFAGVSVHAYTATATERVRKDIATELGLENPTMLAGSFDRPNLHYRIERRVPGMEQVLDVIGQHSGESGIVYCISRKEVDATAAALNALGHSAVAYHAGLSDSDRMDNQDAFLKERISIVVATVAFGMGIDKSNVRFVIHAGMPKSLEAYQQESGRAGRDGLDADCCLFFGSGDFGTWKRLMSQSGEANEAATSALQAIDRFCNSSHCRHKSLVEHFGQAYDQQNCQACDICLGEVDQVDGALILAQKILSCVVRLDQRFGADYTSQVLVGSKERKITERGHDNLSTYAILSEYPKSVIRDWLEQLVGQGCAKKTSDYNVVQLTDDGWKVLRGQHTPTLLKPAPTNQNRPNRVDDRASWDGVDRPLFEMLRDLRRDIAADQEVPAYVIFNDATLRDIARRRPSTTAGLLAVSGVGQKKCEDYGEQFLDQVAQHCNENGVARDVKVNPVSASPLSSPNDSAARTAPNASAIATFPFFEAGESIASVSAKIGRAESTVAGYLDQCIRHQKIVDPSPWVDEATVSIVRDAIQTVGKVRLKPIFEHLGGNVPYDQIRIVMACDDSNPENNDSENDEAGDDS